MRKLYTLAILFAALTVAPAAFAGAIGVDAGWYGFCFGDVGSPATAGCLNEAIGTEGNTFTFVAVGPVLLQITDAFIYGDVFNVSIDGGLPIVTSAPGVGPTTGNPDVAFASPYSKLSVALGAGAHFFDIFTELSPVGGGGAYVQVITDRGGAVPEPGSLFLLGGGLLALAGLRLRK